MLSTAVLFSLFGVIVVGLVAAIVAVRRHQMKLLRQREALQKQRGAAHIREVALAAQSHTGRADIAVMLLQLSCEMLEEATQLAPDEAPIGQSLAHLRGLIDSLHIDDRPATPVPNPDSQSDLLKASMQLTEAMRLLNKLELRAELGAEDLRGMQIELRRVQRSLELRTRMRRELETPAVLIDAPGIEPGAELPRLSANQPL